MIDDLLLHEWMEEFAESVKERIALDHANLDEMTPHARQVEVTRRRIVRCEQRFRDALNFTRYEDDE